ncbi:MAG: hypothetical protein KKA31_03445 [Candidatus Margulisbacteria bacterium]|nr:hypothetical protein [Candidatus Margulisiibacteriota bacterium]
MRRIASLMIAVSLLAMVSTAWAGTYLFGYTPGGVLGGGLRFDLAQGWVVDLSASGGSGSSGSTYNLYGDVFCGNWGVGLLAKKPTVNADTSYELSLQYAVEQPINDSISLGVLLLLVNYDTTSGADPNMMVLPTISPYVVLAL